MGRYLADRGCPGHRRRPVARAWSRWLVGTTPTSAAVVGTITDLPYADEAFDAAMYWYSTIHSPDDDLPRIAGEARRVVRPDGLVLVAFQVGEAARDVGEGYRALGHDVRLTRFHRSLDQWSAVLEGAGLVGGGAAPACADGREGSAGLPPRPASRLAGVRCPGASG